MGLYFLLLLHYCNHTLHFHSVISYRDDTVYCFYLLPLTSPSFLGSPMRNYNDSFFVCVFQETGAFVYGAMSFLDKMSNGVIIQIIQLLYPKNTDKG